MCGFKDGEVKWFDGKRLPAGWSHEDPALKIEEIPTPEEIQAAQELADKEAQEAVDAQAVADKEAKEAKAAQKKADALAKKQK